MRFFDVDGRPIIPKGDKYGSHEGRLSYDRYGRMTELSHWDINGQPAADHLGLHRRIIKYETHAQKSHESTLDVSGQRLYFTIVDGEPTYQPIKDSVLIEYPFVLDSTPSGALVFDSDSNFIGVTPLKQNEIVNIGMSDLRVVKPGYLPLTVKHADEHDNLTVILEADRYRINVLDGDKSQNSEFKRIFDLLKASITLSEKEDASYELERLIELGHVTSTNVLMGLALERLEENPTEVNRNHALKLLELGASRGDAESLRLLGGEALNPTRGFDLDLSVNEAWHLIETAADGGSAQALLHMGDGYLYGNYDFPFLDKERAVQYYMEACIAGHPDGCFEYSRNVDNPSLRLKYGLITHKLEGGNSDQFLAGVYSTCGFSKKYYGVDCNYKLARNYAERAWHRAPNLELALELAKIESSLGNYDSARNWISKASVLDEKRWRESIHFDFISSDIHLPDTSEALKGQHQVLLDLKEMEIHSDDSSPGLGPSNVKFTFDVYSKLLQVALDI